MFPALLLALSSISLAACSPSPEPLHIPLNRRILHQRSLDDYARAADNLRAKYGFPTSQGERKRQNKADNPMVNHESDSTYSGVVNIGTPPQPLNLILDTGSADLWAAIPQCTSCQTGTPFFVSASSSTFKVAQPPTPVTIRYGSGQVSGTNSSDFVAMGGFVVPNQTLLAVSAVSGGFLFGNMSGLMGLGFSTITETRATPFWENLFNAGQFASPDLSFFFTRFNNVSTAQLAEPGGVFTLGGSNSSLYTGDIEFLPLAAAPSFWTLNLSGLTVNGRAISTTSSGGVVSVIDTGTTLIGGPTDVVGAFWAAVPGSQALSGGNQGLFAYPCSTNLEVTMTFGGKTWPISSGDMNLGPESSGSNSCVGGIFDLGAQTGFSGGPAWVVGDTFLKNVYTVFRAQPPSVGFAQLSAAAGGSAGFVANTAAGNPPAAATSTPGGSRSPASGAVRTSLPVVMGLVGVVAVMVGWSIL